MNASSTSFCTDIDGDKVIAATIPVSVIQDCLSQADAGLKGGLLRSFGTPLALGSTVHLELFAKSDEARLSITLGPPHRAADADNQWGTEELVSTFARWRPLWSKLSRLAKL